VGVDESEWNGRIARRSWIAVSRSFEHGGDRPLEAADKQGPDGLGTPVLKIAGLISRTAAARRCALFTPPTPRFRLSAD
jgi:hypothetical protein